MFVIKRTNDAEEVSFDKVLKRIKLLSENLQVNFYEVAQKVCTRIFDGVRTSELDELAAQMCSSMMLDHPDYGTLASRIIISNHHKNTSPSFSETVQYLFDNTDLHGNHNPLITNEFYEIVRNNKEKLNSYIDYGRDYNFDYFGFKTLEKAYLMRVGGRVVERPQHMFMRVALGIHGNDIKDALQTYDMMSTKHFVHATPTLFNSGTKVPQMSSCYLYGMDDSIDGIFKCLKDCAHISKYAGGIGIHIHNVRARNSVIRGTNGVSTGIVPMLRVYNSTARYVNQCFAPDTLVMTIDGARRIDSVLPRDKVLTIDGTYQQVLGVAKNDLYCQEILEFTSPYMVDAVRVTKVHELYALDTATNECKYIPAEAFDTENHMMCFPIEVVADRVLDEATLNFIKFCGLFKQYGRVFANGYDYSIKCNNMLSVSLITQVLRHYGVRYWLYHNKSNASKIVRWVHSALMPCLTSTRIAFENGVTGAKAYLEGVFMNSIDSFIEVTNGAQFDYQMIAVNAETILSCYVAPNGACAMQIDENPGAATIRDLDIDVLWFKVNTVRKTVYTGPVYDLNVRDNHNYTTTMGLVHNSGRRNGSIAVYMEPWHGDIEHFLEMRKNHGNEEERARDLFYALWIPDIFMKRVHDGGMWSLMCPDQCKGLSDCFGDDFDILYKSYEEKGMYLKQVKAQDLWFRILESQIETGTPYMLYKDHVNKKNMQSNIGIVKSSNLCSEIVEVSDHKTCAVCNLASMCLPTYVDDKCGEHSFDFDRLHEAVKIVVKNLNKVIDRNFYPIEEAKSSNLRDRPIGIGVQGLADVFAMLKTPYESERARTINRMIFETMYHAALEASMELAKKLSPYETFEGSPASCGILQFDLWDVEPSDRYDWIGLKTKIKEHGLRNSLVLAPMPTASTSQIMGFTESFEPITSNIYKRKTLAGEFILVNRFLVNDLQEQGLWNSEIKNHIIVDEGSIQNISQIPQEIRDRYKTVWECKMRNIIDMAADRGAFIDQSQSMNLYVENPEFKKLTAMHFYAWRKGLKTGMYYLRSKAKSSAQKFTVDPRLEKQLKEKTYANKSIDDEQEEPQVCETCSA